MSGPEARAHPITPPTTVTEDNDQPNALSEELAELLRTGPFEAALRAAIRASRLSRGREIRKSISWVKSTSNFSLISSNALTIN